LKLTPLSKMVGKYLSSIIIYYDGDTGLPHGFEMITPKSDKTVLPVCGCGKRRRVSHCRYR
ncbi:MAG TPA: hypothetical protein VJ440_05035, partial [Candidatus Brocadiaceae bacterium]|nr:hypothetical protein [Candidatus Brocadiaceae bacterium]